MTVTTDMETALWMFQQTNTVLVPTAGHMDSKKRASKSCHHVTSDVTACDLIIGQSTNYYPGCHL